MTNKQAKTKLFYDQWHKKHAGDEASPSNDVVKYAYSQARAAKKRANNSMNDGDNLEVIVSIEKSTPEGPIRTGINAANVARLNVNNIALIYLYKLKAYFWATLPQLQELTKENI